MTDNPSGEFRTTELSLAASLWMNGLSEVTVERLRKDPAPGDDRAVWVFTDPDGKGVAIQQEILAGTFRVEPVSFMRALSAMRNALYDFLDGSS